jgi:hypothetical protein
LSEIEAGVAINSAGSNGMDVTFTQHDVINTAHFDFITVFGPEKNAVTDLATTDVLKSK